jgi:L-ascorbate metabolism protein UlaG (beta-lactamase superfamily)
MDHMDFPSLRRIHKPSLAVTARATADLLRGSRVEEAEELHWGEAKDYKSVNGELKIEAFKVKHWGARYGKDRHRGYNGYILSRNGRKLLLGGDTAMTPLFKDLKSRGPFEAAVMPIAAYRPWIRNHCTPEEALRMANEAGADYVVPIHHSTYKLSDEPMTEPMERMTAALEREPERLAIKQVGETFIIDSQGNGRRLAHA